MCGSTLGLWAVLSLGPGPAGNVRGGLSLILWISSWTFLKPKIQFSSFPYSVSTLLGVSITLTSKENITFLTEIFLHQ